ncbi:MAG: hypothetical protein ACREK8_10405 [Gemmatimonadales bacterium]
MTCFIAVLLVGDTARAVAQRAPRTFTHADRNFYVKTRKVAPETTE